MGAGTNKFLYPVKWFQIYLNFRYSGCLNLFHVVPKRGEMPRLMSKGTPCHIVQKALTGLVENPMLYGSHSCRRGGVTAAVQAEVDMLLIARHGNWKSTAVYLYVADSIERKLSVSQSI